jgi:hypothetical protein
MAIKPLSPLQAKLMRLALDSGAADGEALNALSKLRNSLKTEGPDPHELVDALQNAGFATPEESPLPPVQTKPDYGLCRMPFRKSKHHGEMFADIPPYELRSWCRWAMSTPELVR